MISTYCFATHIFSQFDKIVFKMDNRQSPVTNLETQFAAASQSATISSPANMGMNTINLQAANTQNQPQGQVVLQLTNQVDSRSIRTITMSNIGYQAFESVASLVKQGQSLDTYCDSDVRHVISVNLGILKKADPTFCVDANSDIRDIIHAMKNFYNKGIQLKKARSFVETFRYEHTKDPERTLIEKEAANTEYTKNLGALAIMVEEEKMSEDEIVEIIKMLIHCLEHQ